MDIGTRVRVIDPQSAYLGKEGEIVKTRPAPLPLGVLIDDGQGTVLWCNETELEVI